MGKSNSILKGGIALAIAIVFILGGSLAIAKIHICGDETHFFIYDKIRMMQGSWVEQASGFEDPRWIQYIHAVNDTVIWAAAWDGPGRIPCQEFTKTVNGGDLWDTGLISEAPDDGFLSMIFALNEYTAWVPVYVFSRNSDRQGIWKTIDGGLTWLHQDTADFNGEGAFPNVVHFWDENIGWCQGDQVGGEFEIYTTTDGGDHWNRVPGESIPDPLVPAEFGMAGWYDVVGDNIWFGTNYGRIFKSSDRGYTWEVYQTPFEMEIDVVFTDENHGLIQDRNRLSTGDICETNDGGETWTLVKTSGQIYWGDLTDLPGVNNGYVCVGGMGIGAIWGASYSVDGGHTWNDFDEMNNIQLISVDFVEGPDGPLGWVGTLSRNDSTGGIYKFIEKSEPLLYIDIDGGKGLETTIQNIGFADATNIEWEISIDGGFIVMPRNDSGEILALSPGETETIIMRSIGIGLGLISPMPEITVTAESMEGATTMKKANARIIFSRVFLQ